MGMLIFFHLRHTCNHTHLEYDQDNRLVVHSGTGDYPAEQRRHAVRLTPQAEVPIPA